MTGSAVELKIACGGGNVPIHKPASGILALGEDMFAFPRPATIQFPQEDVHFAKRGQLRRSLVRRSFKAGA